MEKGTLYLIGTPIGNLKDITLRAIETLKMVDVVLAEDTRQTLKLLNHLEIKKRLICYHRHNEDEKVEEVVRLLDEGKNVGLVSDAGMPIISDPGHAVVNYLVKNGYKLEVIPGVTAITTAIVMSALDSTRFTFEGFLSVNKKQRRERIKSLENEERTMIFYEAPHKILYTLKDIYEVLGNRNICLARELTKIHESFIYDKISNVIHMLEENPLKGEMVLMIEGKNKEEMDEEKKEQLREISSKDMVIEYIKNGIDKKDAIKKVAKEKGISKNEVYKECLDI